VPSNNHLDLADFLKHMKMNCYWKTICPQLVNLTSSHASINLIGFFEHELLYAQPPN